MERIDSKSWSKKWWWVALFSLSAAFFYCHALQEKKQLIQGLAYKRAGLQKEYLSLLKDRDNLSERMASQSDPAWVEMVLMRDLGVVPEGWLKVHFK